MADEQEYSVVAINETAVNDNTEEVEEEVKEEEPLKPQPTPTQVAENVSRDLALYWLLFLGVLFLVTGSFQFNNPFEQKQLSPEESLIDQTFTKCIMSQPLSGYLMNYDDCWEMNVMKDTTLASPMRPKDALSEKWYHFTGDYDISLATFKAFYQLAAGKPLTLPDEGKEGHYDVEIKSKSIRLSWRKTLRLQKVIEDLNRLGKESTRPDGILVQFGYRYISDNNAATFAPDINESLIQNDFNGRVVIETPTPRDEGQTDDVIRKNRRIQHSLMELYPNVLLLDGVRDRNPDYKVAPSQSASRFAWTQIWTTYGIQTGVLSQASNATDSSILNEMVLTSGQRYFILLAVFMFLLWQPFILSKLLKVNFVPDFFKKSGLEQEELEVFVRQFFGLILAVLVAMFADLQNIFPSLPKTYSRAGYYIILIGTIGAAWLKREKLPPPRSEKSDRLRQLDLILNREQTEEWKGWLQFAFILYHYMGAHESYVYYPVRVYVSCYIWLTGYGNFVYFYKRQDYSLRRVVKMMIRINLLISMVLIALPEVQYMRYYICPLHSLFFLMVYGVMRIKADKNHDTTFMIVKLAITLGLLVFVHEILDDATFNVLWTPLQPLLKFRGEMKEWRFRFGLDGYATWFGMVCAFAITKLKESNCTGPPLSTTFFKRAAVVAGMALLTWISVSFPFEKHTFVRIHRYSSLLAIAAYVVLRNCTNSLRDYYLPPLAWVGRHSLEIYILQCQLFMNHNGEAHLSWTASYPAISLLLNALIVFFFSKLANEGTLAFNNFMIPSKKEYKWILLQRILPVTVSMVFVYVIAQI